jgi:D-alanyl-D-alanine carboxypeptidase-like protein
MTPLSGPEAALLLSLLPPLQALCRQHRAACLAQGVPFILESGFRSTGYQALLYTHPELHPGTPAAKPGTSKHEHGGAYDVSMAGLSDLQRLVFGQEAERLGLIWGGRFLDSAGHKTPDWGHVELPFTLAELAAYATVSVI